MKILQINSCINSGSTGRIAEEIASVAAAKGFVCYGGYGAIERESKMNTIRIGSNLNIFEHGIESFLFDNHGFASRIATRKFIKQLNEIKPDIIHLHNIHGYYIHVGILFEYLKKSNIPVVWTFHDCWPMTGHCSYFDRYNCRKWETQCYKCPNFKGYPKSLLFDFSTRNFKRKKQTFTGLPNITIVTPSNWLADIVHKSFLKDYPVKVINNGVDIRVFRPITDANIFQKYNINLNKKLILGVASIWDKRKGLDDFILLSKKKSIDIQIILVGLNNEQMRALPDNVIGIPRTESVKELAELYSFAHVFVNPTYIDNFPTTNIEALACGTPVVTYKTGGSPEAIDLETGYVVEQGNIEQLYAAIHEVLGNDKKIYTVKCRERALKLYNKNLKFQEYINLYNKLLSL